MPLAGKRIVVTRPRELSQGLAALIASEGGEPLLYPAIEIRAPEDLRPALAFLERIEEFDLAVFVSPSAVHRALALLRGRTWPQRLRVAAIGAGTRHELEARGFRDVIAPAAPADSEALLGLPEMAQVAGARVLILRGAGGRELIGETLAARGARVAIAECYRRVRPAADAAALPAGRLDAICVSSGEALENLIALLGLERLARTPVFVPHARVVRLAREIGLREAVLAGPGDAQMLARMLAYFGGTK